MTSYLVRFAVPLAAAVLCSGFQPGPQPDAEFVGLVKAYLGMGLPTDWSGIEKLPQTKWAALPPTSLKNCLPNGDCYARQGTASVGGRTLAVVASGARTMVINLLMRNMGAPLGDPAIVAAFKQAGFTAELARCPIKSGAGGTNWYRLKAAGLDSAYLSIQPAGPGRPNEGYVLSRGHELPALQPAQLASYTEQCAPGAERKAVATQKPHEALAQIVVALLAPAAGLYDWKALAALTTEITWADPAPKAIDYNAIGDPNPMTLAGAVAYGGRKFSVRASGTATQVKTIHLEEIEGTHPRGEHMLGVVYEKGIAVRLVRCGPVYTESTNNWYGLSSAKTRPATIRQSIHYDGNRVSDVYELRLDGSLPARDPRDRNPGVNGC